MASETGAGYTQFEDAFPLADAWLALCLVAAAVLPRDGAAGGPVLAPGREAAPGSTCAPWTCSTTCRRRRGKGDNGVMELAINIVTLGLSLFVLRWTWVRREALLSP